MKTLNRFGILKSRSFGFGVAFITLLHVFSSSRTIGFRRPSTGEVISRAKLAKIQATGTQIPIIDGSTHPELVPDEVAYSAILRVIADRPSDPERRRRNSYISYTGIRSSRAVNALIDTANRYSRETAELDAQAKTIRPLSGKLSAEAQGKLAELDAAKQTLLSTHISTLNSELGPDDAARLKRFADENVKRKIKIF